jgi:hypothetical protein
MLTGPLRNKVDALWNAFWTGGIANPLTVIEQITYMLFLKRLDDNQFLAEKKPSGALPPERPSSRLSSSTCAGKPSAPWATPRRSTAS